MPRLPAGIEPDDECRQELEPRAGSLTLPYRMVARAKIVLLAAEEPYASARKVVWMVDNGSARPVEARSLASRAAGPS